MPADGEINTGLIEIRIRALAQLFNSLDPSPFHERDLDDDAAEYIVSWARELPRDIAITIVVYVPKGESQNARDRGLDASIANYFSDRAANSERNLRELFRNGWRYLSIGLPVLVACLVASQLARANLGTGAIARAVEESLIIVGWVANWKPIETFLYDWWPLKRQRDLYLRLAKARLIVREQ